MGDVVIVDDEGVKRVERRQSADYDGGGQRDREERKDWGGGWVGDRGKVKEVLKRERQEKIPIRGRRRDKGELWRREKVN